jgi:hypothetical protein
MFSLLNRIAKTSIALAVAGAIFPADAISAVSHGLITGGAQQGQFSEQAWNYINLSSSNSSGENYDTWTDPHGHTGVKYFNYQLLTIDGSGACYEVETWPASGTSNNTDTRIYAQSGSSSYQSASDDIGGGYYTSKVRAWIPGNKYISLRIQGYSSYYNNIDFQLHAGKIVGATNASSCQVANTPFLDLTSGSYPTFVGTN